LVETTSVITSRTLISADKVKGANVYNLAGDKLGIDDIMIDRVAAATAGSSCIMTLEVGWLCRLSWNRPDCRHGGYGRGMPPSRRRKF
jgi:hypothetical protein